MTNGWSKSGLLKTGSEDPSSACQNLMHPGGPVTIALSFLVRSDRGAAADAKSGINLL